MRIISCYLTTLDYQVTESVNILVSGKRENESLNQKTEWGGAKIPSLLVNSPKGLAKDYRKVRSKDSEKAEPQKPAWILEEAIRRGQKRLKYTGDDSNPEDG